MPANEYHFTTHWYALNSTLDEVSAVLADAADLPRWWPSVYLQTCVTKPGDARGVGREVELYTKGWLPYTLRWTFRLTENNAPRGMAVDAWGDFVGRGVWIFEQAGPDVHIVYDWRVRAEKPLLRFLSPLLKPVFAANHRWAMARGEESLRLELQRRRATSEAARALIKAPPGPTPRMPWVVLPALAVALLGALGLRRTLRGRDA
ncbi:MAG: SRPBCC family protein [Dehalococcoidia bacterium]